MGVWTSPDPKESEFNVYSYCYQNPLLYTDPDGMLPWDETVSQYEILHDPDVHWDPGRKEWDVSSKFQAEHNDRADEEYAKYTIMRTVYRLHNSEWSAPNLVLSLFGGGVFKIGGTLLKTLKLEQFVSKLFKGKQALQTADEVIENLPQLRQQYVNAVSLLADKVASMRSAGMTTEQIARALHAERRVLGEQFKNLTPADKLAQIYERNLKIYGDKLGPSIKWLRENGKSWDQIIESACRTGGKDLGF